MRDHVFHSLEQINAAFAVQLNLLNAKRMQGKSYGHLDRLTAEEKVPPTPLPPTLFERKKQTAAKEQRNDHVILGGQAAMQCTVSRHRTAHASVVHDNNGRDALHCGIKGIAVHKRNRRKHAYTTLPGHMAEKHRTSIKQRGWEGDSFRQHAERIGPNTRWAIEQILTSKQMIEQTSNSCLGSCGSKTSRVRIDWRLPVHEHAQPIV